MTINDRSAQLSSLIRSGVRHGFAVSTVLEHRDRDARTEVAFRRQCDPVAPVFPAINHPRIVSADFVERFAANQRANRRMIRPQDVEGVVFLRLPAELLIANESLRRIREGAVRMFGEVRNKQRDRLGFEEVIVV